MFMRERQVQRAACVVCAVWCLIAAAASGQPAGAEPAAAPKPVAPQAAAGAAAAAAAPAGAVAAPKAKAKAAPAVSSTQAAFAKNTKIISTQTQLDGEVMDMQWIGPNKNTVLVLTEDAILHRSPDRGKTFSNQMTKLQAVAANSKKTVSGIRYMLASKADPNSVFFVGSEDSHFTTTDAGKTFKLVNSIVPFEDIKLHPTHKECMMAAEDTCSGKAKTKGGPCYRKLWVSHDFGQSWTHVADRVQQFDWTEEVPVGIRPRNWHPSAHSIIATIFRKGKDGNQNLDTWDTDIDFIITNDEFKTTTIVVPHGNRFLVMANKFFVARNQPKGKGSGASTAVDLMVCEPALSLFIPVEMPSQAADLKHHGFTVVDTSEGQVFLQINHEGDGAVWGHLYMSDASGYRFSLSLQENRRNDDGTCDFAKFEGMQGVYVANYFDADSLGPNKKNSGAGMGVKKGDTTAGAFTKKSKRHVGDDPNVRSVITFNKGGQWNFLQPPASDSKGKPTNCFPNAGCSLHIHGTSDYWGPFYSLDSAIGLAMATGNLGTRLTPYAAKTNTYFTRDGGVTWNEAAKGSHIYEFGDHGGLILMTRDNIPTNKLVYSWDQGQSWTEYEFSKTKVEVNNIIIERSGKGLEFLLYGTAEGSKSRKSIVYYLDFTEHMPPCKNVDGAGSSGSDFELWEPRAVFQGASCILGHEVKYTRRKRNAACMTGLAHAREVFVRNCECVEADYECDIDYYKDVNGGACVLQKNEDGSAVEYNMTRSIAMQCNRQENQGFYYQPTGYRRVAGDTCTGGVNHLGSQSSCPSWALGKSGGGWLHLIIMVGGVVLLGYGAFTAKGRSIFGTVLSTVGGLLSGVLSCCKSGSGNSGYGSSQGYKPVSAMDDESDFQPYADDDGGFRDNDDDDSDKDLDDIEHGDGGDGYSRDRRHAERIARALDGVEDDDDGDDLDFDDGNAFNPREDESLL
jgi:hypothetical protein